MRSDHSLSFWRNPPSQLSEEIRQIISHFAFAGWAPLLDGHGQAPSAGGAYVLRAKDGEDLFQYPEGRSSIIYIGKADDLAARLQTHAHYTRHVKEDRRELPLYWPRYEYAAKFGAEFTYALSDGDADPKTLEACALEAFAFTYRAFPVGNGAGSWRMNKRQMAEKR